MTENEAFEAAEALLSTLDKKGHTMKFVEAKMRQRYPGEWSVLYDLFSPEGTLIDGPIVVLVDEVTNSARLMEGP